MPDDLPRILDHVGRTEVTTAHTDRLILRACAEHMRKQANVKHPQRDCDETECATRVAREKLRTNVPQLQAWLSKLQTQAQQSIASEASQYSTSSPQIMMTPPSGQIECQP